MAELRRAIEPDRKGVYIRSGSRFVTVVESDGTVFLLSTQIEEIQRFAVLIDLAQRPELLEPLKVTPLKSIGGVTGDYYVEHLRSWYPEHVSERGEVDPEVNVSFDIKRRLTFQIGDENVTYDYIHPSVLTEGPNGREVLREFGKRMDKSPLKIVNEKAVRPPHERGLDFRITMKPGTDALFRPAGDRKLVNRAQEILAEYIKQIASELQKAQENLRQVLRGKVSGDTDCLVGRRFTDLPEKRRQIIAQQLRNSLPKDKAYLAENLDSATVTGDYIGVNIITSAEPDLSYLMMPITP